MPVIAYFRFDFWSTLWMASRRRPVVQRFGPNSSGWEKPIPEHRIPLLESKLKTGKYHKNCYTSLSNLPDLLLVQCRLHIQGLLDVASDLVECVRSKSELQRCSSWVNKRIFWTALVYLACRRCLDWVDDSPCSIRLMRPGRNAFVYRQMYREKLYLLSKHKPPYDGQLSAALGGKGRTALSAWFHKLPQDLMRRSIRFSRWL